jgi:lipooligosaccharide transport system permease protein
VQLVRHAVFGFEAGADLIHLGVLVAWALITWRVAVAWLQRKLID